jgi:hypothetical protein
LREIAAASDFDFIAAEPRPARAAKRGKPRKKPGGGFFARMAKIGRYGTPFFAVTALVGLLAAIAVNAMFMQHDRHPAPLFGSTVKIEPPRPAPRPQLGALLADKLPSRTAGPVSASAGALSAPPVVRDLDDEQAGSPPIAAPPSAGPKKSHDAIGALISGKSAAPAPAAKVAAAAPKAQAAAPKLAAPAPKTAAEPAPSKSLLSAQRALHKLGAPVAADGHNGAATRKALETFQRDNHLPVTGELTAQTRKALAARSGLAVE